MEWLNFSVKDWFSRLTKRLSWIKRLNLLASAAKNVKVAKINGTVTLLRKVVKKCWWCAILNTLFQLKLKLPYFQLLRWKKLVITVNIISNTAVTTRESIKESLQLRSCIFKTVNKSLGCCELKVIFHSQQFISL